MGHPALPILTMTAGLDLFFANGHLEDNIKQLEEIGVYKQQNQLFRNRGDRTYTDISDVSGDGMLIEKSSRGAIFGDYDNDGDLDILVTNINDTPDLLRTIRHPFITGSALNSSVKVKS